MYKAFISYSHKADASLSRELQAALERFTKPWYRRRAMRVFRDATNLSVNPKLWSSIVAALAESEFFLLMASPQAAQSPWVRQELDYWLAHQSANRLLIILTDGELRWDRAKTDFDWSSSSALPREMTGRFTEEPNYLDFRWTRGARRLTLSDERFQNAIAGIASELYQRPKDELIGEDLREHRRTLRHVRAVATLLFLLVVMLAIAAYTAQQQTLEARRQTQLAERRLRAATSRELAAAARDTSANPQLCLLLAIEAITHTHAFGEPVTPEAQQALHWAIQLHGGDPGFARGWPAMSGAMVLSPEGNRVAIVGEPPRIFENRPSNNEGVSVELVELFQLSGHAGEVFEIAFAPDGERLATAGADGTIRVWSAGGRPLLKLRTGARSPVLSLAFSSDAARLASGSENGFVRVWEVATGRLLPASAKGQSPVRRMAFSPDGAKLAVVEGDSMVRVLSAADGRALQVLRDHPQGINAVVFSADSGRLATAAGATAFVWDAATGVEQRSLVGHLGTVADVAFDPDGRRLATASLDRTIRIWDVTSGQTLLTLDVGPEERFSTVFFSRNGSHLASVGTSSLRIFPLEVRELLAVGQRLVTRALTADECQRYLHVDRCPSKVMR